MTPDLTEREQEVVDLMVNGKTRAQIAEALSRSPNTIDKHRLSAMRKLGATSDCQLGAIIARSKVA